MTPIIPTVGRMVWFYHEASHVDKCQPLSAQVSFVHEGGKLVNLGVLTAEGDQFPKTSVPLVQEGETPPSKGPFCMWMPFQRGQAAAPPLEPRVAELERKEKEASAWREEIKKSVTSAGAAKVPSPSPQVTK